MSDLARLARAYRLAARAHLAQRRRGSGDVPYINHPIEVAHLVAEAGGGVDVVVAAVLHDVVEDSAVSLAEIRAEFGDRVGDLVEALTNPPDWDELPKREMKARQAEHVRAARDEVKLVKIADQTSNVHDIGREPGAWEPGSAREYLAGSGQVVDACRGASACLERRFDDAVARARAALGL